MKGIINFLRKRAEERLNIPVSIICTPVSGNKIQYDFNKKHIILHTKDDLKKFGHKKSSTIESEA